MADSLFAQSQQPMGTNPLNIGAIQPVTTNMPSQLDISPIIKGQQEYRAGLQLVESVKESRRADALARQELLQNHIQTVLGATNAQLQNSASKQGATSDPVTGLDGTWLVNQGVADQRAAEYAEIEKEVYRIMGSSYEGSAQQQLEAGRIVQNKMADFRKKWDRNADYQNLLKNQTGITNLESAISGFIQSNQGYSVDRSALDAFWDKAERYKNGEDVSFSRQDFDPSAYVFKDASQDIQDWVDEQQTLNQGQLLTVDELYKKAKESGFLNDPNIRKTYNNGIRDYGTLVMQDENGNPIDTGIETPTEEEWFKSQLAVKADVFTEDDIGMLGNIKGLGQGHEAALAEAKAYKDSGWDIESNVELYEEDGKMSQRSQTLSANTYSNIAKARANNSLIEKCYDANGKGTDCASGVYKVLSGKDCTNRNAYIKEWGEDDAPPCETRNFATLRKQPNEVSNKNPDPVKGVEEGGGSNTPVTYADNSTNKVRETQAAEHNNYGGYKATEEQKEQYERSLQDDKQDFEIEGCDGCTLTPPDEDGNQYIKFPDAAEGMKYHEDKLMELFDPASKGAEALMENEYFSEKADKRESEYEGGAEEALKKYTEWATVEDLVRSRVQDEDDVKGILESIAENSDIKADTPLSDFSNPDEFGPNVNRSKVEDLNRGMMAYENPEMYNNYLNSIGKGSLGQINQQRTTDQLASSEDRVNVTQAVISGDPNNITAEQVERGLSNSDDPKVQNMSKNYSESKKKYDDLIDARESLQLDYEAATNDNERNRISKRIKKVDNQIAKLASSPKDVATQLHQYELDNATNSQYDKDLNSLADGIEDGGEVFINVDNFRRDGDTILTKTYRIIKSGNRYRLDQIDPETGARKTYNRKFKGVAELKEWLNQNAYSTHHKGSGVRSGEDIKMRKIRPHDESWEPEYNNTEKMNERLEDDLDMRRTSINIEQAKRVKGEQPGEEMPTQGGASVNYGDKYYNN